MKQKKPDWLPQVVHPNWQFCPAFDKDILADIKQQLKMPVNPNPPDIFKHFHVDPDNLRFVIVSDKYPFVGSKTEKYENFSDSLKEIWDKLEKSQGWQKVEWYLQPDLEDWYQTLIISTSLTEKQEDVWEPFMKELFTWFTGKGCVICFVNDKSYKYAQYCKTENIFYGFNPETIGKELENKYGQWLWGLPF